MKHTIKTEGKENSWIEDFHASRAFPPKKTVIGKCHFCGCDATQKQCQLYSPTTRSENIFLCEASECFNKAMDYKFKEIHRRD